MRRMGEIWRFRGLDKGCAESGISGEWGGRFPFWDRDLGLNEYGAGDLRAEGKKIHRSL